jgi:exonuclease SbcC
LDQVDRELAQIAEQTEALSSNSSDLDHQLAAQTELTAKRQALETERVGLAEKLAKVQDHSGFLADQLLHLGEIPFDPVRFEALQTEYARLEQLNTQLHQLQDRLTRLDQLGSDLADLDQKLARVSEDSSKLREAIDAVGFDRAELDRAATNWQSAQQTADFDRNESIRISHAVEIAAQELKHKEDRLREFALVASELETGRQSQFQAELLARLFADFRKELIAKIRPRLADLTSSLLADMTDNRYTLVELDEDYNLAVNDLGQFFGVERFSGGESDLANLCLRLAISQALTESAGLERSFVILDEVFGSQDESRRDLVFQGLAKLKGRFPQMLLITHFEELKQKVEMLIEMVPTQHGWSEVRVNGKIA